MDITPTALYGAANNAPPAQFQYDAHWYPAVSDNLAQPTSSIVPPAAGTSASLALAAAENHQYYFQARRSARERARLRALLQSRLDRAPRGTGAAGRMLSPPPEPPIANAVAGPTAHNAADNAAFNAASLMAYGPVVELSDDSSSESESDDESASESESESLSELLAETERLTGPQPSLPAAKNEDTSEDLIEITAEEFRGSFAIVIPTPSTASSQWAPIPRPAVLEESSSEESEDSVSQDEESDEEPTGDTDANDAALAASEASLAEMEGLFTQIDAANNARRARFAERLARMEARRAELFGL